MPNASTFGFFALASLALAVIPGPAVTYVVTHSIDKGRRAGIASAFGVASGGLLQVAAATAGLSALILSSATAFTAVKLFGAAYLIAVGVRRWLAGDDADVPAAERGPTRLRRLYAHGVVVNVLNPKTALFLLAFLPQFVDAGRGSVPLQVGVLGSLFVAIALSSDLVYAVVADAVAGRLRRGGAAARIRRFATGGIFVALGATAALARRQ